jgi:hypothetical protein
MLRQVGYTKNAKIIFQDFDNGDVTIKQNEADESGIFYPYDEWEQKKAEIAEMETISEEFNPYELSAEEKMHRRAMAAKAAARIALQVLGNMIRSRSRR